MATFFALAQLPAVLGRARGRTSSVARARNVPGFSKEELKRAPRGIGRARSRARPRCRAADWDVSPRNSRARTPPLAVPPARAQVPEQDDGCARRRLTRAARRRRRAHRVRARHASVQIDGESRALPPASAHRQRGPHATDLACVAEQRVARTALFLRAFKARPASFSVTRCARAAPAGALPTTAGGTLAVGDVVDPLPARVAGSPSVRDGAEGGGERNRGGRSAMAPRRARARARDVSPRSTRRPRRARRRAGEDVAAGAGVTGRARLSPTPAVFEQAARVRELRA